MGNKKVRSSLSMDIVKDIQKNINVLDKKFRCDLKEPDSVIDTDKELHKYLKKFKKQLVEWINELNQSDKKLKNSDHIEIKKIQKRSRWFRENDSGIQGVVFNARFMMYILSWIHNSVEDIIESCYILNDDSQWVEYEEKSEYVDLIMDKTEGFVNAFWSNQPLGEYLQYFMELNTCVDVNDKPKKVIKKIDEMYYYVEYLSDIIGRKDDSEITQVLCSIGYMYVVHNSKTKNPIDIHQYRIGDETTEQLLSRFGKKLLRDGNHDGWNIVFRYFIESNPEIYTNILDVNHDKNLFTAVLALYFVSYISGDKKIETLVNKLT